MQTSLPVICLFGPTAIGKTAIAIELAERLPCEIISVDSAMIYKEMNIGTAKPDNTILAKTPHALIDFLDPSEAYSVGQFAKDAQHVIDHIQQKNKVPLLVGGTMMYFRMLQRGIANIPDIDPKIRSTLKLQGLQQGWPKLHEELSKIDTVAAQRIHINDSQRIMRALEVYYHTGQTITAWHALPAQDQPYRFVNISLMPDSRMDLSSRIKQRLDLMLQQGFIGEVANLFNRGDLDASMNALRSVGYAQVWQFLLGQMPYAAMYEEILSATRQLAKQQMTWIRSWPKVHEFNPMALDFWPQLMHVIEKL